jgi:hypothetical protein
MPLFARHFLTEAEPDVPMPDGRYDEDLALWVDEAGLALVGQLDLMPTRADRDRPGDLGTITKADRDRDHVAAAMTTKTSAGRDKDRLAVPALLGLVDRAASG